MTIEDKQILWNAVNKYAAARRGDMGRVSVEIQHAVVEVENAVERIAIRSFRRATGDALNSGNGSYRP